MIRNILFDFDGVILDSMKIKGDGFVELLKEYPESARRELEKYHYANGGVSRFAKIRYFFNQILHQKISETEVEYLSDCFGKIIAEKLFASENLISDTVDFIKKNYVNYNFHIVSGAEHQELNHLCKYFNLTQYFKSIEGSPTKKEVLIYNIMLTYKYHHHETALIGDSENDSKAAKSNNIIFYGYNNDYLRKYNYIDEFQTFRFE